MKGGRRFSKEYQMRLAEHHNEKEENSIEEEMKNSKNFQNGFVAPKDKDKKRGRNRREKEKKSYYQKFLQYWFSIGSDKETLITLLLTLQNDFNNLEVYKPLKSDETRPDVKSGQPTFSDLT
ncbi:hypothetical protein BTVI_140903 [Pitangus sulphuratus]|nr:hypothetical protein BTVI_140903 [Pitangus sulphuratus]